MTGTPRLSTYHFDRLMSDFAQVTATVMQERSLTEIEIVEKWNFALAEITSDLIMVTTNRLEMN